LPIQVEQGDGCNAVLKLHIRGHSGSEDCNTGLG